MSAIELVGIFDGIFIQLAAVGQEYCDCIFLQPICIIMASNKELEASFHAVLEGSSVQLECTVKALEGHNSSFFQVKFVKFLKVSANLTILQCLQHENKSVCPKIANLEQF